MGRLLRAAGPPLLLPLLLPLLAGGAFLGTRAAGPEEPGPEGLTSTSLLDLLLPTGLEPLDPEEPSEAMGLGAGLGAPGSGFPSEESEESRILQPPQYFWEEEEALNDSSLDLGPTADYGFPDLTEKAGRIEDTGQSQEGSSLPSALPKTSLVEPPWHAIPGEEEDEEEEEREKEEGEEEEEEEEQLLPVTRSQEEAHRQVHGAPPTSSSEAPGAPEPRHEESGDQASSGVEVGSSVEPSLSPPAGTLSPVALGAQGVAGWGAGGTALPAAGRGLDLEAPREPSEEAAAGAAALARRPGEGRSPASFPQTDAPAGAGAPDEDPLHPGASAAFPLAPRDVELTPSSAPAGQGALSQQPQEGQASESPSRTPWDSTQVICKDWSNLAGKNYIVLNMAENVDCEVFRQHRGLQLLALLEGVLSRHGRGRHGGWRISLSKPSEEEQRLLMALVGEQGVVPTQDVLSVLGDVRRSLAEIGIQNYSSTGSCQARAGPARSDYGTLFVVLVVIGAACVLLIALGLLYNCWQRRLPKLKHVESSRAWDPSRGDCACPGARVGGQRAGEGTARGRRGPALAQRPLPPQSHGEELRFVENGCHDNPTLDVASDSQSEMQEKQPSLNGGGAVNGPGGWSALMGGKRDPEDSDVFEEDTHLYLLEQRDVEVNVRDKWDSTPLYYACLCGHEELVLYLLASALLSPGARCEANTFDGERCLYGAQSDAIRRALRDYKQVTASRRRRGHYYSFLLRLLEQGVHSDVVFVVHGKSFRTHRCILGARSTYFAHMLDTKWKGKSVVVLRHPLINPVAFGALLQYLYTGCLDVGLEHVSDCERLAKQCQLWELLSDLEAKLASKPSTCVKVLTIEPPQADPRLRDDLALLADCALPPELLGDLGELPFPRDGHSSCPDVCFRVDGHSFLCHKAFFCGRSDYFRALLDDHFRESEELEASSGLLAITLHGISPDIFTHVLYYVYSDHTELPPDLAYDVLSVADMYLLPGLKQLCGRSLAQLLDEDSVVGVWRLAKLFGLARLEDQCTKYMARVIEKLVEQEDFVEAVREEAAAVASRQETDSIPLVDDIRFHLGSTVQTCSAMQLAEQRLRVLEELLVSIGLDC
ncbi:podocalyxin-like protein 2 isoform X2 [Hippopotamus amphibius kiboko]|uniref:podocalyxin-like protein 2 isoform X2 n=1 Tax=Hippopotamus amphibius kiboko TaxID=575201 RepID=UPI002598CA5A|nr:podocalyxin-like protein 2 isoform X2 [Hippopotamus amphibius kiboko]